MDKKNNFINDLLVELKTVSWPTREDAIKLTMIVFIISLIVATYLGIIDILLAKLLEFITKTK